MRSERIESQHFGHLAVVEAEGHLLFAQGNPHHETFMRSAAKPFQALPLVEDGLPERFGWLDRELALVMSSHNGEARHVDAAAGLLKKIGRAPEDLRCGVHAPLGAGAAKELADHGKPATVLHNNCSGKHAGMLAACVHHGWPIDSYLDPQHPHQRRIHETVAAWSSRSIAALQRGIDGCSAPVFYLSMYEMALMYARLVSATQAIPQRIVRVFMSHPEMIAGNERFDTALMQAAPGKLIAKIGAEGIQCIGVLPQTERGGLGIAVKMTDGASRAVPPVVIELLVGLGVLDDAAVRRLGEWHRVSIANHRGIETGCIEAVRSDFTS